MKKGVIILWLAVVLTGIAASMPTSAWAAEKTPAPKPSAGETIAGAAGDALNVFGAITGNTALQATGNLVSANAPAVAQTADAIAKKPLTFAGDFVLQILAWVVEILIAITTFFLAIIGWFFNLVVDQMVVGMGRYVTSETAEGVRIAWGITRDLANIGIIGGLIASAIGTILQLNNVNLKTFLVRLILTALLVNFSYFFAGAVIDSSNFLATKIYESTIEQTEHCKDTASCSIASTFMNLVNIQGLRDNQGAVLSGLFPLAANQEGITVPSLSSMANQLFFDILLWIFELVTIFIFISAIGLLVGRFVGLIFILIASPVGVVGFAIPKLDRYAKEWWQSLFTQAFFAPVYFLLVGFSFTIIRSSKQALIGSTVSGTSIIGILLTFVVAAVFMLQSLRIAKTMSEQAKRLGDVYKAAQWATGWAPKGYTQLLKFGGAVTARNVVGNWIGKKGGELYRDKIAAPLRLDQTRFKAADRWIQEGLGKLKDKKFFGFQGYEEVKEAQKKRERLLGEVELDQQHDAEMKGKLTLKELLERRNLRKKAKAGKALTEEEEEELKKLKAIDPKTRTATQRDRLAALESRLSREEKGRLDELEERTKAGGALGIMNDAEKRMYAEYKAGTERLEVSTDRLNALSGKSKLSKNERMRLADLSMKDTLTDKEKAEHDQLVEKEKQSGLSPHERAELQNLELIEKAGRLGGVRSETWHEYWQRQKLRGALGRQKLDAEAVKKERAKLERKKAAGMLTAGEQDEYDELDAKVRSGTESDEERARWTALEGKMGAKDITRLKEIEDAIADKEEVGEDRWAYHEKMDQAKIDSDTTFRVARGNAEAIYTSISDGFWEREYDRDPRSLLAYAKVLTDSQFVSLIRDKNIRRDIRDAMMRDRAGTWAEMVLDAQKKVDSGQYAPGSPEYSAALLVPYNYQGKSLKSYDVMKELLLSDATIGGSAGDMKFRELRRLKVFPHTFSSTVMAKLQDERVLSKTESRDIGTTKRAALDALRDQMAGMMRIVGMESAENLPSVAGTVDYYADNRSVTKWADRVTGADGKGSADIVLKKAQIAGDEILGPVSRASVRIAEEDKRYAQMIQKKDNPFATEMRDAVAQISKEEYAEARKRGISDKQYRDAKRMAVLQKYKDEYETAISNGALEEGRWERFLADPKMFLMHRNAQVEKGTEGFYEGKNDLEELKMLNKRTFHSLNTPIGISAAQVEILHGQDIAEQKAFTEQMLIRGNDSMLAQIVTNHELSRLLVWPSEEKLAAINEYRKAQGKPELPSIFSPEEIIEAVTPRRKEPPPTTGPSKPPTTPSGGSSGGSPLPAPSGSDVDLSESEVDEPSAADLAARLGQRTQVTAPSLEAGGGSGDGDAYAPSPQFSEPAAVQGTPTQSAPIPVEESLPPLEDLAGQFDRTDYSGTSIERANQYMSRYSDDAIVGIGPNRLRPAVFGAMKPQTLRRYINAWSGFPEALSAIRETFRRFNDQRVPLQGDLARFVNSQEFIDLTEGPSQKP